MRIATHLERGVLALRKSGWRLLHSHAPNASALFILGAQRSGTTLLLACFEQSMEFDVLGEVSRAMLDFRIRPDEEVREIVRSSRHKLVVFKPLTDSHRGREFLDLVPGSKAIWAFRRAEDRANSAVAKFGDHNLQILREFSDGGGMHRWQAQGLTSEALSLVRRFDYERMLPETAAAIFWYLRNSLLFSTGLDRDERVLPLAYEDFVREPRRAMQGLCRFVGARFDEQMIRKVHARSVGRSDSRVAPEVMDLCESLYSRMHELQHCRWHRLGLGEAISPAPAP